MSRIIFLILGCWLCHVCADEIYLRNGRVIHGKIVNRQGGRVEIKIGPGAMFVKAKDIVKVVRKVAPSEIFRKKYAALDRQNVQALFELAQWCKKKLPYKYTTILIEAQKAKLDQAIRQAGSDADRLYQVVVWARQNHLFRGFQDLEAILCRRIIGIAPDHAGARLLLGQQKYQGQWLSHKEAKLRESRDFAAKMRAKGFVRFNQQWMRPQEAKWHALVAELRQQIEQAQKQRTQAESQARRAQDQAEQAKRRAEEIAASNRQLAIEIARIQERYNSLQREFDGYLAQTRRFAARLHREIHRFCRRLHSAPAGTDPSFLSTLRSLAEAIRRTANQIR